MSEQQQLFCPNCRGGNAPDAQVCRWCGVSLVYQPVYQPPPQQPQYQPQAKQNNNCIIWAAVSVLAVIVLCVGAYFLFFATLAGGVAGFGKAIEELEETLGTPIAEFEDAFGTPIAELESAFATPTRPAASNQPAPPLSELFTNKQSLTDARWDSFAATLAGKRIDGWEGTISNVDDNPFTQIYEVTVDVEEPESGGPTFDLTWEVSEAEALTFEKGQVVTVTGNIQGVDCMGTICPIKLFGVTATQR